MRRRRKLPRFTPEEVLLSRPVRNAAMSTEPTEEGGLRIIIERRPEWWVKVLSAFLPIPKRRPVDLDPLGKEVWELCDGEHTLREMVKAFQERHMLSRAEAEWSLRTYLRDLAKRNLVAIAVPRK